MKWSIKSIAGSPKDLLLFAVLLATLTSLMLSTVIYMSWDIFKKDHESLLSTIIIGAAGCSLFIKASRQKTNYRYTIYNTNARLVYAQYSSKHAKTFCKIFTYFGIFLLLLMGLMSGSLLFLLGPGGIALMAGIRLLNWKVPIKRETSLPWHEYNFVTVDRKRRFIVAHVDDPTLGFEARLPNDELFEEYLAFLHSVLPATAQYTEKKWNESLI
ncbi:permease [Pseudomonas sp. v388]|nr:permease [Pseudomonas sp. v388]